MINILFEELPDAVEVSGKFYKIATDFRDQIAFFDMMADTELDRKQKMLTALAWFSEEIPEKNSSQNVPTLSWLYDSAYVLGAFRQVYGIYALVGVFGVIRGFT